MPDRQDKLHVIDRPSVSIVVPAFNADGTIDDCVESLLRLDRPAGGLEIIVVNNGSNDGTQGRLERFGDRIRIVQEGVRGAAAARNAGIRLARGEYLAFTDADCIAEHDWLVKLIAPLSDPRVGIVGGAIEPKDNGNRIAKFSQRLYDQCAAVAGPHPYAISANWASSRNQLVDTGLFDESLIRGQDYDLARRIRAAGYKIVYRQDARVKIATPSTLSALFIKGLLHGRALALIGLKYPSLVSETPRTLALVRRTLRSIVRTIFGGNRFEELCEAIFNAGKLAGKLHWSNGKAAPMREPQYLRQSFRR
jgi:glycosyltransferase involved in cell wall biosynthesis